MATRRKGWEQLNPTYRKRLERGGLTAESYASGAPLHKARGKISADKENRARRIRRLADNAGFPASDVADVIAEIGAAETEMILIVRRDALDATDPMGQMMSKGAMRNLFAQYEGLVPKEWLYYGKKD